MNSGGSIADSVEVVDSVESVGSAPLADSVVDSEVGPVDYAVDDSAAGRNKCTSVFII
jgi:hypothetical protein